MATLAAFNSAGEYYDAASQTYILSNDVKGAKKFISDGLTAFPNDVQLNKLEKVIKEEEKQQNQNNKDQQNKDQNQQNQDQNKQDQQNKDQNQQDKKDQEKKDDKKQENQDQQKEQQQKEQQQQQAQQDESKQDMKKEEAKRLIELYADDADSLNKPQKKAIGSKGKFQKDW